MREILTSNIFGLYFLYGLSFYTMGLAIAMQYRSYSTFRLAHSLSLLAAFGVMQGLSEWGAVFVPLSIPDLGQNSLWKLEALQRLLQAVSYFFLFSFGAKLTSDTLGRANWLLWVPAAAFMSWLTFFTGFTVLVGNPALADWLALSEIWSRYLLALPGGLLTGYALARQRGELRSMGRGLEGTLWLAAASFIVFGLFGGLITPPASFFPASLLNVKTLGQQGIPVEVFRTMTGFVATFSITRILAIFDVEKERRLDASRRREAMLLERENLSRELHDGVLQGIYGVGLNLDSCRPLLDTNPGLVREKLDYALDKLHTLVRDIREYIEGLGRIGWAGDLRASLAMLAEEMRRNFGLDVHLQIPPELPPVEEAEQVHHLVQVVREALNNAVRHGKAQAATVSLRQENGELLLAVRDNGKGFQPSRATRGYGLANMEQRAGLLGGLLEVQSEEGRGTEVLLRLPLSGKCAPARENVRRGGGRLPVVSGGRLLYILRNRGRSRGAVYGRDSRGGEGYAADYQHPGGR